MSEGHSLPGEHRWMDNSIWKYSKQALGTHFLKSEMDRQVRTQKEFGKVRDTHFLESMNAWTSQGTERIRASKQATLTSWRLWTDRQVSI